MITWLQQIVKEHEEFESPISFVYWAALATISAIIKDQVYWDKFKYKLYPNIYVMLHADSGVKKSSPINMAKDLVKRVNNTRIITGRSSIQGILKELGTAQSLPGGKISANSNAFICSAELTSSIVEDKAATTILTDLYDRQNNEGQWKSLLKMETFELKNPTITMLTATNEAHTNDFFVSKDIHGGFIGRTFIIYEKQSEVINSLMFPPKNLFKPEISVEYLKQLAQLKGEFQVDNSTRKYIDEWYHDFRKNIQGTEDKTGTLNRFDDSVLKVAMLISLGTTPELKIGISAIDEAIKHCEKLVGNIRRTTLSQGRSTSVNQKALLIEELLTRDGNSISRKQLNKKYWMHASAKEWDEVAESLESAGFLIREMIGSELIYRMPVKAVEEWKSHLAGKNNKKG